MSFDYDSAFPEYVSVSQRRTLAAKYVAKQRKKGKPMHPVLPIEGNQIATTFWGKAWCKHLESHADMHNRLSRGRSYVRHGAVVDLIIQPGEVLAQVLGSSLYNIRIVIRPLLARRWAAIVERCHGQVDSLIDLLQGHISPAVMSHLTAADSGILPSASEIQVSCSCVDYASMCKHVSAVLYAIGSRLDTEQAELFVLRHVEHTELLPKAAAEAGYLSSDNTSGLSDADLSGLFGIDLAEEEPTAPTPEVAASGRKKKPRTQAKARKSISKAGRASRISTPAPPPPQAPQKGDTRDEPRRVVAELLRRAKKRHPLNSGSNRGDWLYAAALRAYGSWKAAIEAAGFDYSMIRQRDALAPKSKVGGVRPKRRSLAT